MDIIDIYILIIMLMLTLCFVFWAFLILMPECFR